jgi:hypothetical protein
MIYLLLFAGFLNKPAKGYMWKDIGLSDWLFDMDNEDDIKKIVPAVLSLAKDPKSGKGKSNKSKGNLCRSASRKR